MKVALEVQNHLLTTSPWRIPPARRKHRLNYKILEVKASTGHRKSIRKIYYGNSKKKSPNYSFKKFFGLISPGPALLPLSCLRCWFIFVFGESKNGLIKFHVKSEKEKSFYVSRTTQSLIPRMMPFILHGASRCLFPFWSAAKIKQFHLFSVVSLDFGLAFIVMYLLNV